MPDNNYFAGLIWQIADLLRGPYREVHGSTMQHLTADAFGGFPVLLPPHDQQAPIAKYIDRETARPDALVAAKEHPETGAMERSHAHR